MRVENKVFTNDKSTTFLHFFFLLILTHNETIQLTTEWLCMHAPMEVHG